MANSKVLIEVIATAKGLKVVAKDTQNVITSTQKLDKEQKKASKTQDTLNQKKNKNNKQDKALYQSNLAGSKSFSKMKETIGGGSSGLVQAYATLAANVFAATAAFTALRQASQVEQLVQGLEALGAASGKNLKLLAVNIKEASGQAIALDQALRVASVGASAGFSSTQIEGLAAVARDAAIALGRDVGDAVDRLSRGAAKLEPEILDELGIFVRLDDASAKYAASIGVATSELTRFQQRQAFANEIIEQGGQKFGELGDKVDASAFDRLAATLGDLSRTLMNFFNSVLGPIAGFLSENTMALAGLFAVISRGIIATALPMLNKFSEAAIRASGLSMNLAITEEKKADKQIQSQRKVLKPLKMVKGEYGKLFGKIKQGTATLAEQELANKKLLATIQTRQRNVAKGGLKNLKLKKEELEAIRTEQRELQKLINMEKGRSGNKAAAQFFGAQGNFERRGGNILGGLDEDIGKGDILGGFNKAIKATSRNSKKLMKDTRATTGTMKIFNLTVGPRMTKMLRLGGSSLKIFGLTGKIAIKGLFTAIPVIGQLMLVVDLLIAGLKKAVNFLAGFKGEASELTKANKNLKMSMQGVNEMMSEQALQSKTAGESLIIAANATAGLIDATEKQSKAQAAAKDEAGAFGKLLMNLGMFFEVLGMRLESFFRPITRGFQNIGLSIKHMTVLAKHDFAFMHNAMARLNNLFAGEDEQIELITDADKQKMQDQLKDIRAEMKAASDSLENEFNGATLSLLGNTVATSAEFKSLNEIIKLGGPSLNELSTFMGTGNINTFAQQIDSAKTAVGNLAKDTEVTEDTFNMFNPAVAKLAMNFVEVDKEGKKTIDVVGLLGATLNQGTAKTVNAGKAAEELGETFKNSGEKINTFFTGMREKSKLGPMLTEFKNLDTLITSVRTGEGGDVAFLEQFEKAPASLKKFLGNTDEIRRAQEAINELSKVQTDNIEAQAVIKTTIAALEDQLVTALQEQGQELAKNLNTLIKFELIRKKELALLNMQAKAVGKVKNNSDAVAAKVALQNTISRDNVSNLETQNKLQEQSLTAESKKLIAAGDLTELTDDQREIYAKILTNNVAIAKENEKIVSDEELILLKQQAGLENAKAKNALLTAEAATLAKTNKLLSIEANIRAGIGGKLTPAQTLEAQKLAAKEALKAAVRDQAFQITKFEIERDILEMRMLAADVEGESVKAIIARMNTNFETQKLITAEKVKQLEIDEKLVGKDSFAGLLAGGFGAQQSSAISLAAEQIKTKTFTRKDENGEEVQVTQEATSQERLEALSEATKPMRDALAELGPEGELVATAQQGILTMASAFDVLMTSTDKADQLAAVGAAIGAVSQIMAANSKAQIAEIDKQIEAEKKRDGKSADSLAKIKTMEKKKEAMAKKAFEQNKKMQMAQTIVNTASGMMRAYKDFDGITATALAVMIGAMGAAQLAIISKTQFQGGSSGDIAKPNTSLNIGKRSNSVDVSKSTTSGELNYLRGGRTNGQNLGGAGAAMGRKGYAMGFKSGYADGGVVVGERGPEVITPPNEASIIPNFALGGGETNVNFSINAIDAAGVEEVLVNQKGNLIRMIREAANENGERFLETVDTQTYGSSR